MKLQLKDIAPYLPYGLTCHASGEHVEGTEYSDNPTPVVLPINGVQNDGEYIWVYTTDNNGYGKSLMLEDVFPILRPLHDFDDVLKVNEFLGHGRWCDVYDDYFDIWFDDLANVDKLILQAPQVIFNYFLANHFDVFGLIEKKLAVDINSLQIVGQ